MNRPHVRPATCAKAMAPQSKRMKKHTYTASNTNCRRWSSACAHTHTQAPCREARQACLAHVEVCRITLEIRSRFCRVGLTDLGKQKAKDAHMGVAMPAAASQSVCAGWGRRASGLPEARRMSCKRSCLWCARLDKPKASRSPPQLLRTRMCSSAARSPLETLSASTQRTEDDTCERTRAASDISDTIGSATT